MVGPLGQCVLIWNVADSYQLAGNLGLTICTGIVCNLVSSSGNDSPD